MEQFDLTFDDPRPVGEVKRQFLRALSAPLARNGFEVSSESDDGVTFTRRYPWYTFWGRRPMVIVATFEARGGGTSASVSGTATRKVRNQLAELQG